MANSLNRRTVLAAIPATALLHGHMDAAGEHPDAELLGLGRQFDTFAERLSAEYARLRELDALYDERKPEIPALPRVQEGDAALGLKDPIAFDGTVGSEIRNAGFIERLQGKQRMRGVEVAIYPEHHSKFPQPIPEGVPIGTFPADHMILRKLVPWPEAQARADEIVAAWDRHHAANHALWKELGIEAGEEGCERLEEALKPITDAIVETPATTLDGYHVKARAAFWHERNANGDDLAEDAFGGGSAGNVAASIIRNLLAGEAA